MSAATIQSRVIEFFTLRESAREIATIPEEVRAAVHRELRLAFQKREAAETLWPRGSTAEAFKLAIASLDGVKTALDTYPGEAPAWLPRAKELAKEASDRLGELKVPALEKEMDASFEAPFRALVESLLAIEDLTAHKLAAPNELQQIRNARIAVTTFFGVLLLTAIVLYVRTPTFETAVASSQHGPDSGPEKSFDGDPTTGWAMPDHVSSGWIDFELGRSRKIKSVHILASNPPYNDRDIKDAHIEALKDGAVVKAVDVSFPEPSGKDPNWNDVALDAPKSDHLRITVKSNYKLGAAINEIQLR
jgi:hypothetical protein